MNVAQETEVELAQEQLAANNPMYAPRFQDYIVDTTDASFHANPTFGSTPCPEPTLEFSHASIAADAIRNLGDAKEEESASLLGTPNQATANQATPNQASAEWADWAALGTLRRMSAALAAAVAGNAPHGGGQLAGRPPVATAGPQLLGSVSAGSWQQASLEQLQHMPQDISSFADAARSPSGSLAYVRTEDRHRTVDRAENRAKAAGFRRDSRHSATDSFGGSGSLPASETGLIDLHRDALADFQIDVAAAYSESLRGSSGDLNFAVTDSLDLEELPGRAHQLPTDGQLPYFEQKMESVALQPRSLAFLDSSQAEAGLPTVPQGALSMQEASRASSQHFLPGQEHYRGADGSRAEEYVALGQPAARSSDYALFAQLSAAAAQQEEAHLRLAPFALGYEIPSGSAITKVHFILLVFPSVLICAAKT